MTRTRITSCLLVLSLIGLGAGSVRAQGSPQAEFLFQDSLTSTSGVELENFGTCPGVFSTEQVDGAARRVFAFADGSGLALEPSSDVILGWNQAAVMPLV
ncbi:MAG TPA: hypothetical protein VNP73_00325 [Actinomycetota bacterium]|nr:hypothetical protein [Actinomycetota bacterium]